MAIEHLRTVALLPC